VDFVVSETDVIYEYVATAFLEPRFAAAVDFPDGFTICRPSRFCAQVILDFIPVPHNMDNDAILVRISLQKFPCCWCLHDTATEADYMPGALLCKEFLENRELCCTESFPTFVVDELAEAQAWIVNDDPLLNDGKPLPGGRVRELIDILAELEPDEDVDEQPGVVVGEA